MRLVRNRERFHVLKSGVTLVAEAFRYNRNPGRMIGKAVQLLSNEGLRGVKSRILLRAFPAPPLLPPPPLLPKPTLGDLYPAWLGRFDHLQPARVAAARRHHAGLTLPDILILALVTPDSLPGFDRLLASWQSSIHPGWQAAAIASADLSAADLDTLRGHAAADPRVRVLTTAQEIVAARESFAYTLLCFGDCRLDELSLYMFLEAATRTTADIVYADHDRIAATGQRADPAFKPQNSPEYLACFNYIGDCLLLAAAVAFTPAALQTLLRPTSAGYDALVPRLLAHRRVEHLPFVLSHVPAGLPPRRIHDVPTFADEGPTVAIIIATRNGLQHLKPCIDSILETTRYHLRLVEFILIDNDSREPETLAYLDDLSRRTGFTVLKYPHPFNFADINNVGARATRSDILVFLNNDTLVNDPAWLSKFVYYASQPDVGIVGARLLFPDGTIQHGGCVAGAGLGAVEHIGYGKPMGDAAVDHTREMSLVTGACIAVRRSVFEQVGGFDPILKITWNDIKLCLSCLSAGLRNIYLADPVMIHDESKTREQDNTRDHMARYFSEADYTRRRFKRYFYDDPSYNPNLSFETIGLPAEPPRVCWPWSATGQAPRRILVLSAVYKIGFGVPLVIQQHARKLLQLGYEVVIGGPRAEREFDFPGCQRVSIGSPKEAAVYAFCNDISLIISHTPPFFSVPLFVGGHIPVLSYDYGEPSADFFVDPVRSYLLDVSYQKRAAAALTTAIATISQAVKDETLNPDATVLGLANSHLEVWSESLRPQRAITRRDSLWQERFVVLTVCRFSENERVYKGLDKIAAIQREFPYLYPEKAAKLVWALAGGGSQDDVRQLEQLGFTVFANVSDERLAQLYQAADAYMSFARWEGYNLGIGQALAMGLPTVASDIPAHREFPITTSDSIVAVCHWLACEIDRHTAATPDRRATVYDWEVSTTRFTDFVAGLLQAGPPQSRAGASPAPDRVRLHDHVAET